MEKYSTKNQQEFNFIIKKEYILLALLCFLFAAIGCAGDKGALSGKEVELQGDTFSFDKGAYPSRQGLFPEYHLVPGDIMDVLFQVEPLLEKKSFRLALDYSIGVKFISLPELNEIQRIKPDGKISLPYIGEIYVLDMTVAELTKELEERYSKILRDPELYITVPQFRSQRSRIQELKKDLHTATRGLSRLVTVRPDGYTTFPLIGDVFTGHKTIPQVNKILNEGYGKYMPGLHVDLFLEKHAGSTIYVLGQVREPGVFMISKPITVIAAVALAGGHEPWAKLSNVIVFRRHEEKLAATRVNLKKTLDPGNKSTFFYLKPDDIIFVPRTGMSKLAQIMNEISDILFFRGWSLSLGMDDVIFTPK